MVYFSKWNIALVVGICLFGLIYTLPNFIFDEEPEGLSAWIPHQKVNLGLDLQGGSHLLLAVETKVVIR